MYLDTVPFALECKQCLTVWASVRQWIQNPTQATEANPAEEKNNKQIRFKKKRQIEEIIGKNRGLLWSSCLRHTDTKKKNSIGSSAILLENTST